MTEYRAIKIPEWPGTALTCGHTFRTLDGHWVDCWDGILTEHHEEHYYPFDGCSAQVETVTVERGYCRCKLGLVAAQDAANAQKEVA